MKIILGAGIAGLLLAEILGDYTVITNDVNNIGGQMNTPFPLGPRILHYSSKTKSFLKHLGIEKEPRTFKVGYLVNGELTNAITFKQKAQYFTKTRGHNKINHTTMSEGRSIIVGWDLNDINLVNILYERNKHKIMQANILKVYPNKDYIQATTKYAEIGIPYDDLFSTIPLEVLQKLVFKGNIYISLAAEKLKLQKRDVFFHYAKGDESLFEGNGYDYIYDITDENISRYTKLTNDSYVYEASKEVKNEFVKQVITAKTQIVTEHNLETYQGIKLVGRYAQYNHGIKTNNIIEKFW